MILRELIRARLRFVIFCHDLAWVPVSLYLAYWFRFNLEPVPEPFFSGMIWQIATAIPIHGFLFWFFGLYRGIWRYASIPDLVRVAKSVFLGVVVTALAVFILQRGAGTPRTVFILYPLLLALGLTIPRILYRWFKDHRIGMPVAEKQRSLIVGTGKVAEHLIRNILRAGTFLPLGLVGANAGLKGMEIHGVRVVGTTREAATLIRRLKIEIVLLAAPDLTPEDMNHLIMVCADLKVPCRTMSQPGQPEDLRNGLPQLRPVTVEDLLSREPVELNTEAISHYLRGKRVLVTGAGGSIGSELSRQVAEQQPATLLLFDNSEFNLFQIEQEFRSRFPQVDFHPILGDVKDQARLQWLFGKYRPQVVFHAAAYKHLPLLELNPLQGVQNNVFGTLYVANMAHERGAELFVMVSTDKAVNPTNVMGATKRVAEIYCQNLNTRSDTSFITTRFGNVLGSAGSVVPVFEGQIAQGGPVTVTHPEITRFFMTISEAVGLILQAGSMGSGGEIFVLDMGQAVKIKDLAEQMIRLSGFKPYEEIPIVFTGLRHGEKLHEELFHESEGLLGTSHPKLLLASHRQTDWEELHQALAELETAVRKGEVAAMLKRMQAIVPEFHPHPLPEAGSAKPDKPVRLSLVKS